MTQIEDARAFAIQVHGDQRYGDQPYRYHLDQVAHHCIPYGDTAQIIAYLHDVVEDTPTPLEEIRARYGDLVAQAVGILTDEPGDSRKARKTKTYAKMAAVRGELEIALTVKAADRLANLEACKAFDRPDKLAMYVQEASVFREAVYRPRLCDPLWEMIDDILRQARRSD